MQADRQPKPARAAKPGRREPSGTGLKRERDVFRSSAARLVVMALALGIGAGTALADAPARSNNCAGAFASGVTPEAMNSEPPSFGESRSGGRGRIGW